MWEWNKAPPPLFGPWGIMTAWLHSEDTRREWGFRWDTLLSPAVPLSELWTIQAPPMSMWFVCLFPRGLGPLQEAVQPLGSFPDPIFSSTNGCPGSDVTLTNSKTYHPGDNNQDSKKKNTSVSLLVQMLVQPFNYNALPFPSRPLACHPF